MSYCVAGPYPFIACDKNAFGKVVLSILLSFVFSWLCVSFALNNNADTFAYLFYLTLKALCVSGGLIALFFFASSRFELLCPRIGSVMNSGVFLAFILVFFNL